MNPEPAGVKQLQEILQRIINLSVPLAFITLTIMLVYAGYKFMGSGGDAKNLQTAKQATIWAVMGIGFMALAWVALKTIEAFTGTNLTQFCIGLKPYCP